MDVAKADASELGRQLARARWGSRGVDRAAQTVIARAAELDPVMRAQVHLATADEEDVTDE